MKKGLIIVILLSLASIMLAIGGKSIYGGFGWFEFGTQSMDIDELNDVIDSGYGLKLDDMFYTIGGGGYSIIDNFMIGGEGKGILANSDSDQTKKVTYSGGYGMLNMGYMLYRNKNIGIYPKLGIGGGGMTLEIAENGAYFNNAIFSGMSGCVNYSTFLGDIALGAIYTHNGLIYGIQGGYMLSFSKDNWQIAEQSLPNGPKIGMGGPYIKLILGGGGFSR